MQDIVKNLESLGFTNYESRIIYALFEGHVLTGSEAAKLAKIPRSSAYGILRSFASKGICNEIQTSSIIKYELIDPKVVQDKIELDLNKTYESRMTSAKESFKQLQSVYRKKKESTDKNDVELIKGFNKHRKLKFIDLLNSSEQEVLLMIRLEMNVSSDMDQASKDFYKRGGVSKTIFESNLGFKMKTNGGWKEVTPSGLVELCKGFVKQGDQVKLADKIPQNMAIFDRKKVFISLVDPEISNYNRSDIIVDNENFAKFMTDTFYDCWNKASTVEEFAKKIK